LARVWTLPYTPPESSPPENGSLLAGAIIGGVIALAVIAVLVALLFFMRRKRNSAGTSQQSAKSPVRFCFSFRFRSLLLMLSPLTLSEVATVHGLHTQNNGIYHCVAHFPEHNLECLRLQQE
jgi:hypothetical protein